MAYCSYIKKDCKNENTPSSKSDLFFAYPSFPSMRVESIQSAISVFRNEHPHLTVFDWKDLDIEGNIIFCKICECIKNTSCLVADITNLNFNVIFEFGYAIGSGKPVWPLVDDQEGKDSEIIYKRFEAISTVGHSKCVNSKEIVKKLNKKEPWNRKSSLLDNWKPESNKNKLLYIQSPHNDDASIRISEFVDDFAIHKLVDNPSESDRRSINWYLDVLSQARGVVIHLMNSNSPNALLHNAKSSFIAGLTAAQGLHLCVLVEKPFRTPIDYRDIIKQYSSLKEINGIIYEFKTDLFDRSAFGLKSRYESQDKGKKLIDSIDIGEYVAEDEFNSLSNVYVRTPIFQSCLKNRSTLVIGRKGSGKSALFYELEQEVQNDTRNFACKIKPKGYDLGELTSFIKEQSGNVDENYYIESLWKYILLSEVLHVIYEKVKEKYSRSQEENAILNYVNQDKDIKELRLTTRLVSVFKRMNLKDNKFFSEVLHKEHIGTMLTLVVNYFCHINKAIMLLDGLDANWEASKDHEVICKLLKSLMASTGDLWQSIQGGCTKNKSDAEISIVTFIRSDIFNSLGESISERDKLSYEKLIWNDRDLLFSIIEKRVLNKIDSDEDIWELWEKLLEPNYSVAAFKDDILNYIIKRPRDILFYVGEVLKKTKMQGLAFITKSNVTKTKTEYSDFLFSSVSAESHVHVPDMSSLLTAFYGKKKVEPFSEIRDSLLEAGIELDNTKEVLGFLISSNFLGIEVSANEFVYPESPSDFTRLTRSAKMYANKNKSEIRYKIHRAFDIILELEN